MEFSMFHKIGHGGISTLALLVTIVLSITGVHSETIYLACTVTPDTEYHGKTLDCSGRGMQAKSIQYLTPYTLNTNITTLKLNNNPLHILSNDMFVHFSQSLRRLECMTCSLKHLKVNALRGLTRLSALILSNNDLSIEDYSFPFGFFKHVCNLMVLDITRNGRAGDHSKYSTFIDIFDSLPQLKDLSIESFKHLSIGAEFNSFHQLENLTISCLDLLRISNNSFKDFNISQIKHFSMINGNTYFIPKHESVFFFQYLPPSVTVISIINVPFGNKQLMKMMEPLQGRNISRLLFNNVGFYHRRPRTAEEKVEDRLFTAEFGQYLQNIYVQHFEWYNSYAYAIDFDAFTQCLWRTNLKSLKLITGGTKVIADNTFLFKLADMQKLESFVYQLYDRGEVEKNFWEKESESKSRLDIKVADHLLDELFWKSFFQLNEKYSKLANWSMFKVGNQNKLKLLQDFLFEIKASGKHCIKHANNINDEVNPKKSARKHTPFDSGGERITHQEMENKLERFCAGDEKSISFRNFRKMNAYLDRDKYANPFRNPKLCFRISPYFKNIVMSHMQRFDMSGNLYIQQPNNLRSIAIINSPGGGNLSGLIHGLCHLESFDFTSSTISGSPVFFASFINLTKLVFRKTLQTELYFSEVASNVTKLSYFDLAYNQLQQLPSRMFSSNRLLRYLSLSGNYFKNLPFQLALTPRLQILDFRDNLLEGFTEEEMKSIDNHLNEVTNFSIMLNNNPLSCGCNAMHFLKWLRDSNCNFDRNRIYTCSSQSGKKTETKLLLQNLDHFWRLCHGKDYFFFSLFIVGSMLAAYSIMFITIKRKTIIVSKVMRIFLPTFRLKSRVDFIYDVFIGYANENGTFVRQTLLPYLETKWKLKTFVHQRDMTHDRLLLSRALADSWRCLLLITEQFLNDEVTSHHVMKVSSLLVNPTNPNRLIVLVEKKCLPFIPDFVLQVIEDDQIIILQDLQFRIHYEEIEALRTRIFI